MSYRDRQIEWSKIEQNSKLINDSDIDTKIVMREETELLLNKERTIFNILLFVTTATIILTVVI